MAVGKFSLSQDVKWKKLNDESLILIPSKGEFFKVNATGTAVLQGLSDGKSINQIQNLLIDEFDVNSDNVKEDIDDFIQELIKMDVISD